MLAMREGVAGLPLALGGMLALASAIGIGRFVYTPLLPAMAEGLGLTGGQAGLIASANFCGYLAGALLAAARLPGSRRAWLLGALALGAATTGAMGVASDLPAFLLLRGIGGAASAFVLVFASALVLDRLAAAGRGGLAALHFAGVGVGIAVSAGLVALPGLGWREMWGASGLGSLAAAGVVAWLVPGEEGAARPAAVRRVGDGGWLAWWAVAYGLFGFGYVVTATFLVAIVRAEAALRAVEPFVWLVVGLAAVPSVALWGWSGRRFGLARSFAAACLVEAAGVAASVLWPGTAGALVAAALLGGTFMGLTALGLAGGRALSADDPRRTFAVLTAAFGIGQIVGPVLAGLLHDRTGSFSLPSLLAAAALLTAGAMALRVPLRGEAARRKPMVQCGNSCSDVAD
ncbi:YbfB/YjiJ family MFS transporter [Belnapia sp. T18]|uniref:YbfB/YjiJ family MFS transporter n=1 Tax=Belnapia arida TaxID=2804533 RepID=A0ABS1U0P7_9PROT|nr:YbfB/YjiJ family MFS transporter [Belnapia arida]MBL6078257.1 YbfB/YjiJ family MFS transporter [Belnapia arida]